MVGSNVFFYDEKGRRLEALVTAVNPATKDAPESVDLVCVVDGKATTFKAIRVRSVSNPFPSYKTK